MFSRFYFVALIFRDVVQLGTNCTAVVSVPENGFVRKDFAGARGNNYGVA